MICWTRSLRRGAEVQRTALCIGAPSQVLSISTVSQVQGAIEGVEGGRWATHFWDTRSSSRTPQSTP